MNGIPQCSRRRSPTHGGHSLMSTFPTPLSPGYPSHDGCVVDLRYQHQGWKDCMLTPHQVPACPDNRVGSWGPTPWRLIGKEGTRAVQQGSYVGYDGSLGDLNRRVPCSTFIPQGQLLLQFPSNCSSCDFCPANSLAICPIVPIAPR